MSKEQLEHDLREVLSRHTTSDKVANTVVDQAVKTFVKESRELIMEAPDSAPDEVWADIPGYPNYRLSNHGRIINRHNGKSLVRIVQSSGTVEVGLSANGQVRRFSLGRLVAWVFLPDFDPNRMIEVIDHNRRNLRVDNLRMSNRLIMNASPEDKWKIA